MPTPLFDFFEVIADELLVDPSRVITKDTLQINKEAISILDDLKVELKAVDTVDAIKKAIDALAAHFQSRGAAIPFSYDSSSGRFNALDMDYLEFVRDMREIRSIGKRSRDFECNVAQRLLNKATGAIHRVGFPRDTLKRASQFNGHLKGIGFGRPVLIGKDKDGGFDILWSLPLGESSHSPIVSVQCKNGEFDLGAADQSVGAASRSLAQHTGLVHSVHVPCVLFNDYIHRKALPNKPMNFVPLGLTDLTKLVKPASIYLL